MKLIFELSGPVYDELLITCDKAFASAIEKTYTYYVNDWCSHNGSRQNNKFIVIIYVKHTISLHHIF